MYTLYPRTTTAGKQPTFPPPQDRCKSCRRAPQDGRYDGRCASCYRYQVEMVFRNLPPWPSPLGRAAGSGTDAPSAQCLTCDVRWPPPCLFRDSRGVRKCVLCRRWELMHDVEMHPGVPIHITLGPGRGIRCFECGEEKEAGQYRLFLGIRKWSRTSLFCWDCRHLEARYATQGLINVDE